MHDLTITRSPQDTLGQSDLMFADDDIDEDDDDADDADDDVSFTRTGTECQLGISVRLH